MALNARAELAYWLTTARIGRRRFTRDDLPMLELLYADADVMRHVGGVKDREQTADTLAVRILEYYEQQPGLGIWAAIERESGAFVGQHLLNHIQGEPFIQVGYILSREYWGRGYATEMAAALVRYGLAPQRRAFVPPSRLRRAGSAGLVSRSHEPL